MNFPATKRARIYKKPGVYLSGPLLGLPWRYAAVAELAIAPSELLASVLDIDFPVCLERHNSSVAANAQFRGEAITLLEARQPAVAMAALGHGRRSNLALEGHYPSDPLELTHGHRRGTNPLRPVLRINAAATFATLAARDCVPRLRPAVAQVLTSCRGCPAPPPAAW